MNDPGKHGDPATKWKRLISPVLLTCCLAVTAWSLISNPPHLEFWPTVAFLTVIALGIAIPVGIEKKRERGKLEGPAAGSEPPAAE